ncbi:MAG: SagB/ThcOx family dehydrogenase [Chloroflexi bacterium]|nr:SagB/ThcOx family dehydrogenase [Chloroflexota bacterium]
MDLEAEREFLKSKRWSELSLTETDQRRQVPMPPVQKPAPPGAPRVALVPPQEFTVGTMSLRQAIGQRSSHRRYSPEPLSLEELSFLLWATQGVRDRAGVAVLRNVPSAGNRHPLESYVAALRVSEVTPGLYRYLPLDHELVWVRSADGLGAELASACNRQAFVQEAAAVFVWTAVPYRSEWRHSFFAHKLIAVDAGHVGQNLYLAGEAVGVGTCAIAAYNQAALDAALGVDGTEEFALYVAAVGRKRS